MLVPECPGAGNSPERTPDDRFAALLGRSEVSLSARQVERLARYRDALLDHNKMTNLTAIRDLPGIERRLILESLRLVRPLTVALAADRPGGPPRPSVLDIGTGGGLPGVVLAIALPGVEFTLLDATGKKIAFLRRLIEEIGLDNARTIHGRAEEIARDPGLRGSFSAAVARAVSSLPALVELGLPMLRPGGRLLLPKGIDIDAELADGRIAASIVGGEIIEASLLPSVGSDIATRLVIVEKTGPTPDAYPRRSGLPSRDPLGASSGDGHSGAARRGGNR